LRQALLQLADQTVVAQQPGAVLAPLQQLVDQLIINRRFGASCHVPLLGSVSWLNTQNLLHPPTRSRLFTQAGVVPPRPCPGASVQASMMRIGCAGSAAISAHVQFCPEAVNTCSWSK